MAPASDDGKSERTRIEVAVAIEAAGEPGRGDLFFLVQGGCDGGLAGGAMAEGWI